MDSNNNGYSVDDENALLVEREHSDDPSSNVIGMDMKQLVEKIHAFEV